MQGESLHIMAFFLAIKKLYYYQDLRAKEMCICTVSRRGWLVEECSIFPVLKNKQIVGLFCKADRSTRFS